MKFHEKITIGDQESFFFEEIDLDFENVSSANFTAKKENGAITSSATTFSLMVVTLSINCI
jgi:hypothetical protein